jgi:hypothetical protein
MNVRAMVNADVGYNGVAFCFVILVGGMGCMGAYRVSPVCIVYSTPYSPSAGLTGPPSVVLSTRAGPSVPETVFRAVTMFAGKVPVMPEREKRGEKFVTVPLGDVDSILKKLDSRFSSTFLGDQSVCRVITGATYYAFWGVEAPTPFPIVAGALFPVVENAAGCGVMVKTSICSPNVNNVVHYGRVCGRRRGIALTNSSLPPAQRKSW